MVYSSLVETQREQSLLAALKGLDQRPPIVIDRAHPGESIKFQRIMLGSWARCTEKRGIVMDVLTLDRFGRLHFPEAVRAALGLTDVTQVQL
jgi:hypothetical protein